jgi:ATP-dependent RNA helicase RhlE
LLKRPKIEGGGAFHEKKDKNKKVNLGGPGKRNPKTASKGNRGALKANKKKK